jgi:hypothetical protein
MAAGQAPGLGRESTLTLPGIERVLSVHVKGEEASPERSRRGRFWPNPVKGRILAKLGKLTADDHRPSSQQRREAQLRGDGGIQGPPTVVIPAEAWTQGSTH